jgi:hypothetical protein
MALINGSVVLSNTADNEDIFPLVARDDTAPKVILFWIMENLHCSDDKLREAFECALRMRKWPNRKAAD